jgi:hypothetical protein
MMVQKNVCNPQMMWCVVCHPIHELEHKVGGKHKGFELQIETMTLMLLKNTFVMTIVIYILDIYKKWELFLLAQGL